MSVGDVIAVTTLIYQVVKKSKELTSDIRHFSHDASRFKVDFLHLNQKLSALQNVLLEKGKFGFKEPIIQLLEAPARENISEILTIILELLEGFENFQKRYQLSSQIVTSTSILSPSDLGTVEQASEEDSTPAHTGSGTRVSWTRKVQWSVWGKSRAEKQLVEITTWLNRLKEDVEQFLWLDAANQGISESVHAGTSEIVEAAVTRQLEIVEEDLDAISLDLSKDTRLRRRVFLIQYPELPDASSDQIPEQYHDISFLGTDILKSNRVPAVLSNNEKVIIEFWSYKNEKPDNVSKAKAQYRQLVSLLAEDKSRAFHLPQATGFCDDETEKRMGAVFPLAKFGALKSPQTADWLTLSEHITTSTRSIGVQRKWKPPLEDRYKLASCLAHSVQAILSIGWLHQGIRSDNIVFVNDKDHPVDYTLPFLFGYRKARAEDAQSHEIEDPLGQLYRHPERWEPVEKGSRHLPRHDLYSLGVVLIEIGLWEPVSNLDPAKREFIGRKGKAVAERFKTKVKADIPGMMGTSFQDIVLACLGDHESSMRLCGYLDVQEIISKTVDFLDLMVARLASGSFQTSSALVSEIGIME